MAFVTLMGIAGCMTDPDPIDDYLYGPPLSSSAVSQGWPPTNSAGRRGADGRSGHTASADWSSRSYSSATGTNKPWAYAPRRGRVAKKKTSGSRSPATKTAAKKQSSPSKIAKDEDTLLRTTHTETKGAHGNDAKQSAKSATAKTSPTAKSSSAAKSPTINLGMLHLLNSKRITFHYKVKDGDSPGLSALELWGTRDLRSWKKYDIAKRSPSSLAVDIKDEGLYGFTLIARGEDDLAKDQPPRPGDPPQVWVAVDRTKPVVQLLGAELNILARKPTLVVRWNAKDRNFGPRPITLLYAEHLEGPWTPIAANMKNSGRYEWIMPACAPSHLYVRVQAVDLMGNAGMAQSAALTIPGRPSTRAAQRQPKRTEPPQLDKTPPLHETHVRPVAATVPNPTVSILSVDGE